MGEIIIYRHADCVRCAKMARLHHFFDWRHRVQSSTEVPKTGPLQMGEIVVEVIRTGEIVRGVDALRCVHGECALPQEPQKRTQGYA